MATKKKAAPKKKRPVNKPTFPTQAEITRNMNSDISKFMKVDGIKVYHTSWGVIIPVVTECFKRLKKVKFKQVHPRFWGIRLLEHENKLQQWLTLAVKEDNIGIIFSCVHRVVTFINDKKK